MSEGNFVKFLGQNFAFGTLEYKYIGGRMTSQLWALLVGINYEGTAIRQLSGCVNDVEAMQRFLIEQMGVPKAQIKMLTEQEAKRATIIKTFKEFLIENKDIPKGAQILFHFSGHGSQMLSRSKFEPDGRDETIVPYDSRTRNVYDIPDKTLAGMLRKLAEKKGNNITVVLDCCHSGSGTRALDDAILQTRRIDPSLVRLPDGVDEEWYATIDSSNRSLGPSGWESNDSQHVLIAGCRAHEESREHRPPSGDRMTFGALTYFMLDWLRTKPAGATYGDLHEAVATQVNTIYKDQMPQCEGDRNRQVFGGATVARDPFAKVTAVHGNEVTLDCGVTQGMSVDTELAIYPATVKTRSECKKSNILAKAKITQADGTSATAKLIGAPTQSIEVNCRVLITKRPIGGTRTAVWAVSLPNGDSAALTERIQDSDLLSQAKERALSDVELRYDTGKYRFFDLNGRELCEHSTEMNGACDKLEHMARYRLVQGLKNDQESQIKIKTTLTAYDHKTFPVNGGDIGDLTLTYQEGGGKFNRYRLTIDNLSSVPVFINLFYLENDFSITARYPKQSEPKSIPAGESWTYGLDNNDKLLIGLTQQDEESLKECIKIIATTKPVELGLLAQDGLKPPSRGGAKSADRSIESPLQKLLRAKTSGTRGQMTDDDILDDDWTSSNIVFHIVRKSISNTLAKGVLAQPLKVGGISITQKPEALSGSITIEAFESDARRSMGEGIVLPSELLAHPELCQLLAKPGTRSVGQTGLVVKIETDGDTYKAVNSDSPLVLDISQIDPQAEMLAVTHDGEDFLIVGSGTHGSVTVNHLPEDLARTRANVPRALRLYLFKKSGQPLPELGLHYFERGGDISKPRSAKRSDFKQGDTVALMVHGFLSDTGWMADGVATFLRNDVIDYNHVIGWDYETIGTGVSDNGSDLATALRLCGFGENDGITLHVYAHSMGCLVSRCMIELHGGDKFVDKAVLAGPPNLGTRAADASHGAAYLLTLLLNNVVVIPGPSWLSKLISGGFAWLINSATGWSDLKTTSQIVDTVNALTEPNTVPYLVLAGLNNEQDEATTKAKRIAAKVLDTGLDAFYGEPNDMVIGKHCMTDLRFGTYPSLTVKELGCNHGGYYADIKARKIVINWILDRSYRKQ